MPKYHLIVIWLNKNKNEYYFKKIKGGYCKYYPGYVNQYNHEVILVIDISDLIYKKPLKLRLIKRTIRFLEKFDK